MLLVQGEWVQSPDDIRTFPNKIQIKHLLPNILGSGLLVACSHSENNCLQRVLFTQTYIQWKKSQEMFYQPALVHFLIYAWSHTNNASSGQLHGICGV